MGNAQTMQKISFEDMQIAIKNKESYIIINTLPDGEQGCLILNSIHCSREEALINNHIRGTKQVKIIVYGRNSNDEKIYKKYQQLMQIGFMNVYVYMGGLFEWLLLQDIYGFDEFPTTQKQLDFLKYKPPQKLNVALIEY